MDFLISRTFPSALTPAHNIISSDLVLTEAEMGTTTEPLALQGGKPAVSQSLPPRYPGGMLIGEEEEQSFNC